MQLLDINICNVVGFLQIYNLLGETVDKMAGLFEDIQKKQEFGAMK